MNTYLRSLVMVAMGLGLVFAVALPAQAAPSGNNSHRSLTQEKVSQIKERVCDRLESVRTKTGVGPKFCENTPPPPDEDPTLNFEADPETITEGDSSTLTWSSENATSCEASGDWSGSKALDGEAEVTPTETSTYTLSCEGPGGDITKSVTVTVTPLPTPEPTVTLTALPVTINEGGTSTLTWSSTNATSCEASGGWSGSKSLSGNAIVSPSATTTYILTCQGDGGSDDDSATVNVILDEIPSPILTFGGSPTSITLGGTSTLTWSSTNTTLCEATNAWSGTTTLSGNTIVAPTTTSTYVLTCSGPGGSTQDDVTITVNPLPPPELDHVVISEVYYDVLTPTRGTGDPANEWVELYNDSDSPIDISGWTIGDAATPQTDTLPALSVIPANGFLLIVASSTTAGFWSDTIPAGVPIVHIAGSALGSGFNQSGDAVYLRNGGITIDALSYGDETSVFDPSAPDVADGHSLRRDNLTTDTDTAEDFEDLASPTPGLF